MSRLRRVGTTLLATLALLLTLSSTALASGGSGGGGGSSTGGGGVDTGGGSTTPALCGAITMNSAGFTSYYQYFTGMATNCSATTADYVVILSDIGVHADPLCQFSSTSNKKVAMAPGTLSFAYFKPLPCYDDYTIQAQLTLNRQVAATTSISFTYTPTGIIVH